MANHISPLIFIDPNYCESSKSLTEVEVGDLVTWEDFEGDRFAGRVYDILSDASYLVRLLEGDGCYEAGMIMPARAANSDAAGGKIVDW